MFPEKDPPKPERKAPVFLNELLTPPDPPKSSGSRPSTASTGFPGWGSSQDPAVLAAMMVQAAMMKSSPPVPPMAGTMPYAGQMPPACFRTQSGRLLAAYASLHNASAPSTAFWASSCRRLSCNTADTKE
ncbi:unnamed protein product [Durusdinium trenchii]|uniref:Uncharacterized protein n=1 Tax=Durusdinium trenchii TaxID=1381693 RepID=A0ABP0J9W0_9DINO